MSKAFILLTMIAFFSLGMLVGITLEAYMITTFVDNFFEGSEIEINIEFNETALVEETYKKFEGLINVTDV